MTYPVQPYQNRGRGLAQLASGAGYLVGMAAVALVSGAFVSDRLAMVFLLSVAGSLLVLAALLFLVVRRQAWRRSRLQGQLADFIAHDAAPSFTTDPDGAIGFQNRAAVERFGSRGGQTLTRALGEVFANPAAVLRRLQGKAAALGAAREDLVTRRGHVRLSVHQISDAGFLWRLEEMFERPVGGRGAETISLPMLTVSRSGTILFMNEALRRLVGERKDWLEN